MPPAHNLVIPLSTVSTVQFRCNKIEQILLPWGAVDVGHHNHRTTIIYCHVLNFRLQILLFQSLRKIFSSVSLRLNIQPYLSTR